jgi:uncharacterized protein
MAYLIKGKGGQPIRKNGINILGSDLVDIKLLDLDEKEGSFVARASSSKEDRDKDIVRQEGINLKNFKKNPVIPWSHNYWEPPVAKSIKTWVDGDLDLLFKPKFDMEDPFSVKIFNKYKNGFLTSFSIGFIGLDFEPRNKDDPWFGGRDFKEIELLEISCVCVPANPNANVYVNAVDGSCVKSLSDDGYPDVFAKMKDSFLFYPIRDTNEFSKFSVCSLSGVDIIYGKALSKDHPEADAPQIVGFSFAPNWETPSVLNFIKAYSPKIRKVWMVNIDVKDGKLFFTENKEELEIPLYEKISEVSDKSSYRIIGDKTVDDLDEEIKKEEKAETPPVDAPVVPDAQSVDTPDPEKTVHAQIEVKIEDVIIKVIDALNVVAAKMDSLVSTVDLALNKKSVDLEENRCNNIPHNQPSGLDNKDGEQNLNSGDSIEFDESLLTPEGNPSDSANLIELDIADLSEIRQIALAASGEVSDSLKEVLLSALKNSGRID